MALSDALLPPRAPRWIRAALARVSGLDTLDELYRRTAGEDWIRAALDTLDVGWSAAAGDARRIPRSGATVIVANHPTGMLDGLVLLALLRDIRPDVKILANNVLGAVPELAPLLIPLDLAKPTRNTAALRTAIGHLVDGGVLIVFPVGRGVRRPLESRPGAAAARGRKPVPESGRGTGALERPYEPRLPLGAAPPGCGC